MSEVAHEPAPDRQEAAIGDGSGVRLERRILDLLDSRAATSTICPSEVARSVAPEGWRNLMDPVRSAARRLVEAGEVEITQHGEVVDPTAVRGPIRIRRPRP